jgi:hypothetical protein
LREINNPSVIGKKNKKTRQPEAAAVRLYFPKQELELYANSNFDLSG